MERLPRLRFLSAFISRSSIRVRLLLPLMLIGTLLGLAVTAVLLHRGSAILERMLESDAAQICNDLVNGAQTGLPQQQMQRLVTATASARNVKLALIATGSPLRILASSRSAWVGKDLAEITDARIVLKQLPESPGTATATTVAQVGTEDVLAQARFLLPPSEGSTRAQAAYALVIVDPSQLRFVAERGVTRMIAVLALLGLVMMFCAWLVINRRVVRPLQSITSVLALRADGHRMQRVPADTNDEIGKLGLTLNSAFDEIDDLLAIKRKRLAELEQALTDLRLRDVALAELRDKLALALEASGTSAWECDLNRGEFSISQSWEQIVGAGNYREKSPLQALSELVHEEDRAAVINEFTQCRNGLAQQIFIECRVRRGDGSWCWVVSRGKVTRRDEHGRALFMAGVNIDITERKATEAQLRESQKLEAIGQLTGGLAHDFNNLLGIVVGNLDEIGEHLPEGDARLRLQHRAALEAALRGAEVTHALLAVARRQPLAVGSYDVNVLLAEFLPLARSSAGSAVTVRSHLAAGELRARIDAAGLSNVILNLVINARDAMQDTPGEQEITLRTRFVRIAAGADEALTPGGYALLEVADTGAGMSEQIRAQVFEPFFTTKERGQGTGLGLAMVYGYATQLGGTARIQSEQGRGTTVQLYLPMDAQATVAAEAQRLTALQAHAILDTAPEAQFDALVAEAARICETPIALVSLVDEHRQWFKARVGLQASQTAREQAFCAHAILDPGGVLVVPDATRDVRFSGNPLVLGEPHVGFYAGVVLHDAAGEALGTLCVIDHVPRHLNAVQLAELAALAERVAALIRARRPPRVATDVVQPPVARTKNADVPARATPALGRRVLVVDDEQALCELACDWLESLGYQPTGVHSPAAALERLAAEPFDILFTDIVMPGGMDGLALARRAKAEYPALQILLTSGYAQGLSDATNLPGAVLKKPYRKADLLAAIATTARAGGSPGMDQVNDV